MCLLLVPSVNKRSVGLSNGVTNPARRGHASHAGRGFCVVLREETASLEDSPFVKTKKPRVAGANYFGSSYSPSTSYVAEPSAAPLPLKDPLPLTPFSFPVPPLKLQVPSALSTAPSFIVAEL